MAFLLYLSQQVDTQGVSDERGEGLKGMAELECQKCKGRSIAIGSVFSDHDDVTS